MLPNPPLKTLYLPCLTPVLCLYCYTTSCIYAYGSYWCAYMCRCNILMCVFVVWVHVCIHKKRSADIPCVFTHAQCLDFYEHLLIMSSFCLFCRQLLLLLLPRCPSCLSVFFFPPAAGPGRHPPALSRIPSAPSHRSASSSWDVPTGKTTTKQPRQPVNTSFSHTTSL